MLSDRTFRHTEAIHESARIQGTTALQLGVNDMCDEFLQTSNLIINLDHDDWILDNDSKTLADYGFGESDVSLSSVLSSYQIRANIRVPRETWHFWSTWRLTCILTENETEVSFFNREMYEQFKLHPEVGFQCSPDDALLTKSQTKWEG